MRELSFDKGETIFKEGSYDATMYLVSSGTVGIYARRSNDTERLLAELGPNECFGEMGLVEYYPRSASAVALVDGTTVTEIDSAEFADIMRDQPDQVLSILRQMSARLRETDERLMQARKTAYEVVECESAHTNRPKGLRARLSRMLQHLHEQRR